MPADTPITSQQNTGHGHVYPRPDGVKARCGGPGLCPTCANDAARKRHEEGSVSSNERYEIVGLTREQAHKIADDLAGSAVWGERHVWISETCVVRPQGCRCVHCVQPAASDLVARLFAFPGGVGAEALCREAAAALKHIHRELVALKRSIDPHQTDSRRYEILREDLDPIWKTLVQLLSGDSPSAPKRHSQHCDCHDCHNAKKHPQIPHHALCGCWSCTRPADETTTRRSTEGLVFDGADDIRRNVAPVLGTDKAITDEKLKFLIQMETESAYHRAFVELWERRGSSPETKDALVDWTCYCRAVNALSQAYCVVCRRPRNIALPENGKGDGQ